MAAKTYWRWLAVGTFALTISALVSVPLHLRAAAGAQSGPAVVGQWSGVYALKSTSVKEVAPIHMSVLPNEKILMWEGFAESGAGQPMTTPTYLWDSHETLAPGGGTIASLSTIWNDRAHLFCSGHAFLPDGRLLVAGGGHSTADPMPSTNIFDYRTNRWLATGDAGIPDMPSVFYGTHDPPYSTQGANPDGKNSSRYYPSVIPLWTGEMLVAGGQVGTPAPPYTAQEPIVLTTAGTWNILGTASARWNNWYPFVFSAPDGRVFRAGGSNYSGAEQFTTGYLNSSSGAWEQTGPLGPAQQIYGSAVMYRSGKILVLGGGNKSGGDCAGPSATASAMTIDLNQSPPLYQTRSPMAFAREYLNATVLPDGKVFVSGGWGPSLGVLETEMWNPDAVAPEPEWKTMANMAIPRGYHSTAVLLPDGRVMSAGTLPCGTQSNAEFYSPPYLFKADGTPADRPSITAAPAHIAAGAPFFIATADPAGINSVTLVRLSSVTHAFNQNQRFHRMTPTVHSNGVSVTAPTLKMAPPGHYLLFILRNGVPSQGRVVQLSSSGIAIADYDDDTRDYSRADLSVWRPSDGRWYWTTDNGPQASVQLGDDTLGEVPLVAEMDGDGKSDAVVWRPGNGTWYWRTSSEGFSTLHQQQFGNGPLGDIPMIGDVDGDGRSDLVVWRRSTGWWYWLPSSSNFNTQSTGGVAWGSANPALGDVPRLGDVDGDGKADPVIWRASSGQWFWLNSSTGYSYQSQGGTFLGTSGDVPLLTDVDGDRKADPTIWRPSDGMWRWLKSSVGYTGTPGEIAWGGAANGDIPVVLDLTGDGKSELTVWRPANGTWYWLVSSEAGYNYNNARSQPWGSSSLGDVPLPRIR